MAEASSVFFLIRSLHPGGAERQLVELASGLRQRGHRVAVACYYRGGALDAEVEARGVRLIDLRKSGRWDLLAFGWRLIAALRRERPRVLYSFLGTSNILSAAVRSFVPGTKFVWSVRASDMDLAAYDGVSALSWRAERVLSRRADLIIANSNAGRAHAQANGFPADRIAVVPNGIDVDRFRPDPGARRRYRAEWGIGDGMLLVGLLARIDPMKDHGTFLEAAARLAARRPEARFVCIGAGTPEERAPLEAQAEKLGLSDRLIWAGSFLDPAGPLNALDLCCSSSRSEGFSNAIAEAMACGIPCVVTDAGDSASIVGDPKLVAPRQDPVALAAAMDAALDRLGPALSAAVRGRVVEHYSVERMLEATERLIFN